MRQIFLTFLFLILFTSSAKADWVDSWVEGSVMNYTGPSFYESSQRGYVSFGSLSVRNPMITDQLIAFQPPRLSIGCGGIDLFLGGFHFMDFDYLVQQAQNIISAAPYFAFQYALRAISKEAGSIVDIGKSISDLLNQTQYNSCAMSQRLGYAIASLVPDDTYKSAGHLLRDNIPKAKFLEDDDSLFYRTLETVFSNPNSRPTQADNAQINEGCPGYLLAMLNSGSLLKYIHDTYFPGSSSDSLEHLLRGYLGDIIFEKQDNFWFARIMPSCGSTNEADSFKAFVEGRANEKSLLGACSISSVTSIKSKVSTVLKNAYQSLMAGSALTSNEVNWLKVLPLPILNYMKQLYIYQANPTAIQGLVDPAAYGFGYSIIQVLYAEVVKAIRFIQENKVKACSGNVTPGKSCYLCEQDSSINTALAEFQQRVLYAAERANEVWTQEQQNLASTNDLIMILQEINDNAIRTSLSGKNKI